MVVEGVLAAGQLDVNKIRTSSISVGSEHIDDAYKWMDVDANGVHVHEPQEEGYKGTQIEARTDTIAMRVGSDNAITVGEDGKVSEDGKSKSNTSAEIIMNTTNGILAKTSGTNLVLENSNVGIEIPKDASVINIGNISNDEVSTAESTTHEVNVGAGGNVNIKQGNLHVSSAGNSEDIIFSVVGNSDQQSGMSDGTSNNISQGNDVQYEIIGHGETLFTDRANNARYLSMGVSPDHSAAVNISRGNGDADSDKSTGIIYVDMDKRDNTAHFDTVSGNDYVVHSYNNTVNGNKITGREPIKDTEGVGFERKVEAGSIYIRKGLIDIVPDTAQVGNGYNTGSDAASSTLKTDTNYVHNAYDASDGRGVIRASRFVANNVDNAGNPIKVPNFYGDENFYNVTVVTGQDAQGNDIHEARNAVFGGKTPFEAYNGANRNRYDTYMVNPAYTSVMNDIKLVSRGGARLSDILPTFITKGIYTAVNGAPEQQYRYNHDIDKGGIEIKGKGALYLTNSNCPGNITPCLNIAHEPTADIADHEPASPFIGVIPAPQCPPGYMRVIQITPASIRMAEAGSLRPLNLGEAAPDQYFDGLMIDVNDYTNPTNSPLDEYKNKVSELGDHFLAKTIYNIYEGSKVTKDNGDDSVAWGRVQRNTSKMDVQNLGALDFEMANNLKEGENEYVEGQGKFSAHEAYQKNAKGGELMEINLATTAGGIRNNVNDYKTLGSVRGEPSKGSVERDNKFDIANYRNYNDPSDSHPDVGAESAVGVWRRSTGGINEGNIIDHDVNIKLPGIKFGWDQGKVTDPEWANELENFAAKDLKPVEYRVNDQIDLSGAKLVVNSIKNVHVAPHGSRTEDSENDNVYVLATKEKGLRPLTFQKSTWLKVDAVQLPWENERNNSHAYTAGWAVLMGFIYPDTGYGNILRELGFDGGSDGNMLFHTETGGLKEGYLTSQNDPDPGTRFYWNIFPVAKRSLEAYITTYCYFEESDFSNLYDRGEGEFPMVDRVSGFDQSYVPTGDNKKYREKLNDPSMKYNELW